jgi:hypothetical protein
MGLTLQPHLVFTPGGEKVPKNRSKIDRRNSPHLDESIGMLPAGPHFHESAADFFG